MQNKCKKKFLIENELFLYHFYTNLDMLNFCKVYAFISLCIIFLKLMLNLLSMRILICITYFRKTIICKYVFLKNLCMLTNAYLFMHTDLCMITIEDYK